MRVLLILVITLLAAASAYAYSPTEVTDGLSAVVTQTTEVVRTEPAMLLLSGAVLLGLGGAVRRFSL